MGKPWNYGAKTDFFPERGPYGEWLIVAYKTRGNKTVVVEVGVELTRSEAEVFGAAAVRYWSRKSSIPPMDMHDRGKVLTYFYVLSKKFGAITFEDQQ